LLLDAAAAQARPWRRSAAEFFVPPLIPEVSASPRYPRQAVREAREGYAIVCFTVDASGAVVEPEIVELSDEIFRTPTLFAIYGSRYRPWSGGARPGCRSYLYALEAVR
jgi:hypothetical protein